MNLPPSPVVAIDATGAAKRTASAAFIRSRDRAMHDPGAVAKMGSIDGFDAETLTVAEALYRFTQLSWSITGTASVGADQPIIIKRATRNADGTVCIGSTIGAVTADPEGNWEFLQSGTAQMPDGATYVHVSSPDGGGRTAPLSIVP